MPKKKATDDATILEKALLAISYHGADTFTLAQISQAVGLAPATLLQRFGNKEHLLQLAAASAGHKLQSDLEALKSKNLPWKEELLIILSGMPEGFGSREDIARSLGLLKLDMIDPKLHPIARKLFTFLRKRLHELLIKGQSQGSISEKIDLEAMVWELDALRHGLVIQWTLSGRGSVQNWLKKSIETYLSNQLR